VAERARRCILSGLKARAGHKASRDVPFVHIESFSMPCRAL